MKKIKIADLTPEQQQEQRTKWREEKRQEREAKRKAAHVPTADEASDAFSIEFPERAKALKAYVKEFSKKVTAELGRELGSVQRDSSGNVVGFDQDAGFTVDRVARILFGLKKNWIQQVRDPDGELVGGTYFGDCSGSLVEAAHRYGLKQSQTFNLLYRELLEMLDKRYGREQTEDAAIVRAELLGEYVLKLPKAKPESTHEPPTIQEPALLSDAEILKQGRIRLFNQLQPFRVQDPNVPPQARQYLDGTSR